MKTKFKYYLVLLNSKKDAVQEMTVNSSKKLNLELLVASLLTGAKLGSHHTHKNGAFYLIENNSGPIGELHYEEV